MAYATLQDMIDAKGIDAVLVVADRSHSGAPDAAAVANALDDASSTIDGYLSERFDLPLPTAPSWGKRLCIDIAVYLLADSGGAVTDTIKDRYDAAIAMLRDVSKGIVGLGLAPAQMPQSDEAGEIKGGEVLLSAAPRLFGRYGGGFDGSCE